MSAESPQYAGQELDVFAHAARWKRYWSSLLTPLLAGDVLEVGAGIGATTLALAGGRIRTWTCLEPDAELARRLRETLDRALPGDDRYHVQVGGLDTVAPTSRFDTILYIDVLEHIADDRAELARARESLAPGGRLIVLSPAHQWLFSPFDAAIGHHRRYSKATLAAAVPPALERVALRYLDSAGVLASAANRFFTRQSMPTPQQLRVWDSVLVPVSTVLDRLTCHLLGKSILGVWRRV